jgi:hypothetical protein
MREDSFVSIAEMSAPAAESHSIRSRVSNILPVVGIGLALIVNAAWVTLLGYCILKLVEGQLAAQAQMSTRKRRASPVENK